MNWQPGTVVVCRAEDAALGVLDDTTPETNNLVDIQRLLYVFNTLSVDDDRVLAGRIVLRRLPASTRIEPRINALGR